MAEVAGFIAAHLGNYTGTAFPGIDTIINGCTDEHGRLTHDYCKGTGLSRSAVVNARHRLVELGHILVECLTCHRAVCPHPRDGRGAGPCAECPDACTGGPKHAWRMSIVMPALEVEGQQRLPVDKGLGDRPLREHKGLDERDKGLSERDKGLPNRPKLTQELTAELTGKATPEKSPSKESRGEAAEEVRWRIGQGKSIRNPEGLAVELAWCYDGECRTDGCTLHGSAAMQEHRSRRRKAEPRPTDTTDPDTETDRARREQLAALTLAGHAAWENEAFAVFVAAVVEAPDTGETELLWYAVPDALDDAVGAVWELAVAAPERLASIVPAKEPV